MTCSASTTSSPARKRNIAHLLGHPRFELHAPRRDLSALRRGRRDLQPRLPGLPDPLPARSGADDQDQRARRDQHAGPRQAAAMPASCRPPPARSTATPPSTRRPRTTGATSTRSAAVLLRRGQALRRDPVLRLLPPARPAHQGGPDLQHLRSAHAPDDGRVVSNFIVQALRGEPITIYGDGTQTRSFCYVDDLIEATGADDGHAARSPGRSTSAIPTSSRSASSPKWSSSSPAPDRS